MNILSTISSFFAGTKTTLFSIYRDFPAPVTDAVLITPTPGTATTIYVTGVHTSADNNTDLTLKIGGQTIYFTNLPVTLAVSNRDSSFVTPAFGTGPLTLSTSAGFLHVTIVGFQVVKRRFFG